MFRPETCIVRGHPLGLVILYTLTRFSRAGDPPEREAGIVLRTG